MAGLLPKLLRCTTGPVESVSGINMDVCGAKLLPTTLLAYAPTPLTYALICAFCDITVDVKKGVQNPAVLAT